MSDRDEDDLSVPEGAEEIEAPEGKRRFALTEAAVDELDWEEDWEIIPPGHENNPDGHWHAFDPDTGLGMMILEGDGEDPEGTDDPPLIKHRRGVQPWKQPTETRSAVVGRLGDVWVYYSKGHIVITRGRMPLFDSESEREASDDPAP